MNLLEKLKELQVTTGKRQGNEDLAHWADREKDENLWLRDFALPVLIEVAEAARACARIISYDNLARLDAALAKLEAHHV